MVGDPIWEMVLHLGKTEGYLNEGPAGLATAAGVVVSTATATATVVAVVAVCVVVGWRAYGGGGPFV